MNILVTLDRNYLLPLQTMLGSLFFNHQGSSFDIYLISDDLGEEDLTLLQSQCAQYGSVMHVVEVDKNVFQGAPANRYYSQAMYYRLLAADLLPQKINRILYLDPDLLIINSLSELYSLDLGDSLFAAASHTDALGITDTVNRIRLENYEAERYYNSGVLLMNLEQMRKQVHREDVFNYIAEKGDRLVLPDQDVLNALYGHQIQEIDETIWNFDTRHVERYLFQSQGEKDLDWIIKHTSILHFCGKMKPWKPDYVGYFDVLYKHYQWVISGRNSD